MPIRLALIGCGRISRRHVLAMKDLQERGRGDFVVSAVCDANGQAANERADMFEELLGERPVVYGTHQALLAEAQVDAADLCLPHGLHHWHCSRLHGGRFACTVRETAWNYHQGLPRDD